jgi:hypothetical protein
MSKPKNYTVCPPIRPVEGLSVSENKTKMQGEILEYIKTLLTAGQLCILVQASTGFGKTRIMFQQSLECLVTFFVHHNYTSLVQTREEHKKYQSEHNRTADTPFDPDVIDLSDPKTEVSNVIETINNNILNNRPTHIHVSHLCTNNDRFTCNTQKFVDILHALSQSGLSRYCQSLYDELDTQITPASGGATVRIGISDSKTNQKILYGTMHKPSSTNVFAVQKNSSIPMIGFSATNHVVTTSRLSVLTYDLPQIGLIPVYPIYEQYQDLNLIQDHEGLTPSPENFEKYAPNIENVVKRHELFLVTCPNEKSIKTFMKWFTSWFESLFGRKPKFLVYTSKIPNKHRQQKLKHDCDEVDCIVGIELLCVGFNPATYTSRKVGLHIVFRPFSDKTTIAVSNNRDHDLYLEISATLIQTGGRQRVGGDLVITVYPKKAGEPDKTYYDFAVEVTDIFCEGIRFWGIFSSTGNTDSLRVAQGVLVGMTMVIDKENIKDISPSVRLDCDNMEKRCGRNLITEFHDSKTNGTPFDGDWWALVVEEFIKNPPKPTKAPRRPKSTKKTKVPDVQDQDDQPQDFIPPPMNVQDPELDSITLPPSSPPSPPPNNDDDRSVDTAPLYESHPPGPLDPLNPSTQAPPKTKPNNPNSNPNPHATSKPGRHPRHPHPRPHSHPPHHSNQNGGASGGGQRKDRDFDPEVKRILDGYDTCMFCGGTYFPEETPECAHTLDFSDGGLVTLDNMVRCHGSCHKSWDNHEMVLDPQSPRVWWNPVRRPPRVKIHTEQYANLLRGDNIRRRWEMIKKKWSCTTDAAMYAMMEERGYLSKTIST